MSLEKVITLHAPVNKGAVELLRGFLADAESGDIVAVAVAAVSKTGTDVTAASNTSCPTSLWGAVSRLMHRMQRQTDTVAGEA